MNTLDDEMRLKILVDKQISDITPVSFIKRHKNFSISMKYKQEHPDDDEFNDNFNICLDAMDDNSRDI